MRARSLLTRLLLKVVLPELFTGSTPLIASLNPAVILFPFIGYGLPVLLIRELAVRHDSGLRGLILFGVTYGILNEGLLAKTVILHANLPVRGYHNYGWWFGISPPWMA